LEIKETAFRIDGLFDPAEDAPEKPIYFVGVQFQSKEDFNARFFSDFLAKA
jgi:predicted transposase YdaD